MIDLEKINIGDEVLFCPRLEDRNFKTYTDEKTGKYYYNPTFVSQMIKKEGSVFKVKEINTKHNVISVGDCYFYSALWFDYVYKKRTNKEFY